MNRVLVVVDMQNDFIDGALGTKEAEAIVDSVVKKIDGFDGDVVYTLDTHGEDYLETSEGKNLPVEHCIEGTDGHRLNYKVMTALEEREAVAVEKPSFGSLDLPDIIEDSFGMPDEIELCGLCTDICVISNAMILKAAFPEAAMCVDSACCAGVTQESHENALAAMRMCQVTIK